MCLCAATGSFLAFELKDWSNRHTKLSRKARCPLLVNHLHYLNCNFSNNMGLQSARLSLALLSPFSHREPHTLHNRQHARSATAHHTLKMLVSPTLLASPSALDGSLHGSTARHDATMQTHATTQADACRTTNKPASAGTQV